MNAYAQTLAPVAAATSTFDPWIFGGILLLVVAVAGFLWYKKKNPTGAAALTTTASADLKTLGTDILTELGKVRTALEAHLAAAQPAGATGATGAPAPAPAPGPTPDQLAAVASAQAALDAAKKAAGVA